MKLYLSPSNQPHNAYYGVNTNEKEQMEKVAHKVKALLEAGYDVEVVMATLSLGINKSERPTECKNKGCDFYLAIHSNAAGKTPPCTATGAVCFYHPQAAIAKTLATALVKELNAIAPVKSNRSSSVKSGMDAFNGSGYGEIRSPMQLGVPSALIEVDFHDHAVLAKWITENTDAIAAALVRGIVSAFGLKAKAPAQTTKPDESTGKLYRVQVGAFSNKANAEKLKAELNAKGYDAFITESDKKPAETTPEPAKPVTFAVGDKVKCNAGVKKYSNGQNMASWVPTALLYVRAVESKGEILLVSTEPTKKAYTGRVKASDVHKV